MVKRPTSSRTQHGFDVLRRHRMAFAATYLDIDGFTAIDVRQGHAAAVRARPPVAPPQDSFIYFDKTSACRKSLSSFVANVLFQAVSGIGGPRGHVSRSPRIGGNGLPRIRSLAQGAVSVDAWCPRRLRSETPLPAALRTTTTTSAPAAPRRRLGLLQAAPAHSAASSFCKV